MHKNAKFWALLAVFQVAFGFAVFAVTRDIYQAEDPVPGHADVATTGPGVDWTQMLDAADAGGVRSTATSAANSNDPVEIARVADELFSARQYAQAAAMYERLLGFDSQNVEIHNNLGLTLQYLGRSDEALRWLNKGVGIDPGNQRIWLTLGFVANERGDTATAREALTNATRIGSDDSIRQSAQRMLDALP